MLRNFDNERMDQWIQAFRAIRVLCTEPTRFGNFLAVNKFRREIQIIYIYSPTLIAAAI